MCCVFSLIPLDRLSNSIKYIATGFFFNFCYRNKCCFIHYILMWFFGLKLFVFFWLLFSLKFCFCFVSLLFKFYANQFFICLILFFFVQSILIMTPETEKWNSLFSMKLKKKNTRKNLTTSMLVWCARERHLISCLPNKHLGLISRQYKAKSIVLYGPYISRAKTSLRVDGRSQSRI